MLRLTLASLAIACLLWCDVRVSFAQSCPPIQTVEVPSTCRLSDKTTGTCQADVELERRLELEYWQRVGATDVSGMSDWLERMKAYIKASNTPRAPRLTTLLAAGYLMKYRSYGLLDPRGLVSLRAADEWFEHSYELAPDSPNTGSFHYLLRAFRQFGLGRFKSGMETIDTLLSYPEKYGPEGSEGEMVGALALGLLTDANYAKRTLEILDDCQTLNCQRTSSLAPHKVLGMLMAIAESYAKVGDIDGMSASLARARALAKRTRFPFPERIGELERELTRPGGLIELWKAGKQSIGYVRLPLPPSAGLMSCSTCHVGATLPERTW